LNAQSTGALNILLIFIWMEHMCGLADTIYHVIDGSWI